MANSAQKNKIKT